MLQIWSSLIAVCTADVWSHFADAQGGDQDQGLRPISPAGSAADRQSYSGDLPFADTGELLVASLFNSFPCFYLSCVSMFLQLFILFPFSNMSPPEGQVFLFVHSILTYSLGIYIWVSRYLQP